MYDAHGAVEVPRSLCASVPLGNQRFGTACRALHLGLNDNR